jgi:transposase InsO family protein
MRQHDEDWAVFWCSLLGEILLDGIPAGERRRYLEALSQKVVTLPNGRRKRISLSTLRRKVRQFRKLRIAGLKRKPRSDRGGIRKDRRAMLDRAIQLKREQPCRSPHAINQILAHEFGRTIPKATLNRHFRQAGVTRNKLADPQPTIRCRWTRDQANALWVGDFSEGPKVFHHGQAVKSHLSIWIDCHSRYVVEGRYYFRENLDILLDSLLRAWGSHGASRELYVDNAKVYHSGALKLAAAELNIHLLHRPPRDPSPGGLIERVIQTAQLQFEAEVRAGNVITLDELNRYFQAWLHADYHQTVHSATGQTPRERFEVSTRFRRHVKLSDVLEFFHVQVCRKVDGEFCDVRVNNQYFAVDAKLRGDRVIVVYDPFSTRDQVRLKSLQGKFLGTGRRYRRERGAHPQPPRDPKSPTPLDHSYLKLLEEKHRRQQQEEAAAGIDYHQAQQRHLWSFSSFAATFARLLGRSGGVSALSTHEMELLSQVHNRYPRITRRLLEQAFEQADPKTMVVIVFHLQNLLHARND